MDKKIKTMALFTVLSMMAVSCQKESVEPFDATSRVSEISTSYDVSYTFDGVTHHITLNSEEERRAFIYQMLALAERGYEVTFFEESKVSQGPVSKEKVVYTTPDKDDAYAWANSMMAQGYMVSIQQDSTTGMFTCIAVK